MEILFSCPSCTRTVRSDVTSSTERLGCEQCSWSRPISERDPGQHCPEHCLACGCNDLWRQKDFPQQLGLALVGLGALLSTIAMAYYYPVTALGILLAFALSDLLLYTCMPDVLVCYRCGARHRDPQPGEQFPRFDLATAERYRQEAARLSDARSTPRTG